VTRDSPNECSRPRFLMGVAENLFNLLKVTESHLSDGLLVMRLPDCV